MRPDITVLATPEIAGLPYFVSGLVAAGGLAAAMSTADGLLLAIANALSHDLYYKIIDPKADTKHRLIVARVLRSEEHPSELQSLMRISYAVFCLNKKKKEHIH